MYAHRNHVISVQKPKERIIYTVAWQTVSTLCSFHHGIRGTNEMSICIAQRKILWTSWQVNSVTKKVTILSGVLTIATSTKSTLYHLTSVVLPHLLPMIAWSCDVFLFYLVFPSQCDSSWLKAYAFVISTMDCNIPLYFQPHAVTHTYFFRQSSPASIFLFIA